MFRIYINNWILFQEDRLFRDYYSKIIVPCLHSYDDFCVCEEHCLDFGGQALRLLLEECGI